MNLSLSIYFVGFALGVLFFGTLCDRRGRRPSMLLGLGIYVIASALCIMSPNILILLLSRLIQGFGASVGSIVAQTMMRDLYTGARRSQVFSMVTAALALSPAMGPLVGGFVGEAFGFKGNFAVLLAMGLILLVASYRRLNETQNPAVQPVLKTSMLAVFKKMLADSYIWKTIIMVAGCNGIIFSFYGEAPYIIQKILGYTPSEYGRIGMIIAAASICGAFLSHRLGGKTSSERLVQVGSVLTLLGSTIFFILAFTGLIEFTLGPAGVVYIMLPMALIFVGFGLIIPSTLAVALKAYGANLGVAGAILGLLYYLFIALFTEGMGLLHDGTVLAMPAYFVGISMLMCLVSFFRENLKS